MKIKCLRNALAKTVSSNTLLLNYHVGGLKIEGKYRVENRGL